MTAFFLGYFKESSQENSSFFIKAWDIINWLDGNKLTLLVHMTAQLPLPFSLSHNGYFYSTFNYLECYYEYIMSLIDEVIWTQNSKLSQQCLVMIKKQPQQWQSMLNQQSMLKTIADFNDQFGQWKSGVGW